MTHFFDEWDCVERKSVSRFCFEGSDAAFTENDVWIAVAEDVFGCEKEFFDGGTHAALQKDGFFGFSDFFEEVEILHVSRANLKNVCVFFHDVDGAQIPASCA
jgi:hypothetical protein